MKFKLLTIIIVTIAIMPITYIVAKDSTLGGVHYISDLYKVMVNVYPGDFLVCAFCIQTVHALVNAGAKGNTANQITDTLHLPEGEDNIRETFLPLSESLQTNDKYTLSSANKIYLANSFKIDDKFKRTAVNVFHSEMKSIDFGKTYQSIAEINEWVEEKTHDKIKYLANEENVKPNTVAVFINTLYFQGIWEKQFSSVTKRRFQLNTNEYIDTNMMLMSDYFNYYESFELNAKFLELPYHGNYMTMTFVLPNDVEGLPALESRIAEVLVAPKYTSVWVNVCIPEFKSHNAFSVGPIMKALGVTTGAADFSGLGESSQQHGTITILNAASMEFSEKGATPAASAFLHMRPIDEYHFVADQPFLYYLKHKVNGIVFFGRYSTPENF